MINKTINNMKNKIDLVELLKDCPKGMELDCSIWDNVTLVEVQEDSIYPIKIETPEGRIVLTKYGGVSYNKLSKCIIYPKGKTTWEGFQRPFMDGDIVCTILDGIAILGDRIEEYSEGFRSYCSLFNYGFDTNIIVSPQRLATEEEKAKLFDVIKENGYKWNPETKTLEKLPKFKVGDRIRYAGENFPIKIIGIKNNQYQIECFCDKYNDYKNGIIPVSEENNYMLIPKFDIATLKPFESRVLVRHNKDNKWCGSFFSHIDGDFQSHCYKYVTTAGKSYPMCIPYEGNEHLLNKTADCDIFYKNW